MEISKWNTFNKLASKISVVLISALSLTTACSPRDQKLITNNNQTSTKALGGGGGGGTGDGGGGQGISCSANVAPENLRNKLFVRDIFEASLNKLELKSFNLVPSDDTEKVSADSIKILVTSIRHYFGPSSNNLPFAYDEFWSNLISNISLTNNDLNLSKDANSPIILPEGCEVVQIAYWSELVGPDEKGILYINKKYWNQLDQLNKTALIAHEYFYKQARTAGTNNSDSVRNQIGHLFSKSGLEPLFKEWLPSKDSQLSELLPDNRDGFKYCEGSSVEDTSAYLQMYQYEGKDKLQHLVFPVIKSKLISSKSLLDAHFSFNPKNEEALIAATDLMYFFSKTNLEESIFLNSNLRYSTSNYTYRTDVDSLWYATTDFYTNHLRLPEYAFSDLDPFVTNLKEKLMGAKEISLYSTYLSAEKNPLQISILNPVGEKKQYENKLKNEKELIQIIQGKIRSDLESVKLKSTAEKERITKRISEIEDILSKSDQNNLSINEITSEKEKLQKERNQRAIESLKMHEERNSRIMTLFVAINLDIEDVLHSIKNSSKYERSDYAFLDVIALLDMNNSPQDQKMIYMLRTFKTYLNLALRIKLNDYNDIEVKKVLGEIAFIDPKPAQDSPSLEGVLPGRIQINQSGAQIKFSLSCMDATAFFFSQQKNKTIFKLPEVINTKSNLKFDIKKEDFKSDDELDLIKDTFGSFATSNRWTSKKQPISIQNFNMGECNSSTNFEEKKCKDERIFLSRLIDSSTVRVTPCTTYKNILTKFSSDKKIESDMQGRRVCMILNFDQKKEDFLVYLFLADSGPVDSQHFGSQIDLESPGIMLMFLRRILPL